MCEHLQVGLSSDEAVSGGYEKVSKKSNVDHATNESLHDIV